MRTLALALLLLAATLPIPLAEAASWSVDAKVTVVSATQATYTLTLGTTNVRLGIPDNATFVDARDADGRSVTVREEGAEVVLSGGRVPIVARFDLQGSLDGPFATFPVEVSSAADSPVTVSLALPSGYTLAGYRDAEGRSPDLTGAFSGAGPAYVQYLVLQPGHVDTGPVLGVSGDTVRREGAAVVSDSGVAWTLVTTYDTDVFSRAWDVHVPDGATVRSARSPFGPVDTRRDGDLLRITTPYPVGYKLGARSFTVELTLPAPTPHGGTFREVNLSVRAAENDDVRIAVQLADGLRYAGTRVAGGVETAPLQYRATGPLSVGVAYLPPPAPDHVQFSEGVFIVDAPRGLEAAARAVAANASGLLPRAAYFAYDVTDTRPFFVAYTDAPVFNWEEGFYSNSLNTISIRSSTLDASVDGQPHLLPVGVLIHEATHGLIDRRLPDAPHELSFLHEGLSRLAETHAEAYFPAGEVVACAGGQCSRHSSRLGAEELREFHAAGRTFDVAWHATDVPEGERGFLYDYSGLVMHAFEQRAPTSAIPNALAFMRAMTFEEKASADSAALLDVFLRNAPGTSSSAFLYPGREASSLTEERFRFCMGSLVAPGYPWQTSSAPPGGCPATGYGARDATLPAPPSPPAAAPQPEEQAVIEETVTPPPRFTPPSPEADEPRVAAPGGSVPGASVDGGTEERVVNSGANDVPAVPLALGLVALVVLALVVRRR